MIDLEERYLHLVKAILARHLPGYEVRLFGSRVRGTARKFSDLDLAVLGDSRVPDRTLAEVRDAFAESNLPYRVDVLDWQAITPDFRRAIDEQGFEVIQRGEGEADD